MYSAGHADIMKHKKDVGGESILTLDMVREAQEALRGIARRTPLDRAPKFGENVYIKAENLQLTGAFKLRGAYNKIRSLTPEEAARGVIACSAGNHAQGIALSASRLGIKAVICMPAGAPISKVEATRGYGAEVVLVPGVYDDAAAEAERLTKEQGYTFAHPFNDPLVIAGQGTIGLEILEQLPDVEQIVVPIGGGGLIGGIAFAVKQLKPDCRIVGVQAAGAASMYLSRHAGGPTELRSVSTIADGIAVKKPGDLTFALCQQYVDEVVTVSEDEIASAILALMEGQKTVAEGAGAVPVANPALDAAFSPVSAQVAGAAEVADPFAPAPTPIPVPQTMTREQLAGMGGAAAATGAGIAAAGAAHMAPAKPAAPARPLAQLVDVVTGDTYELTSARATVGRERSVADVVLRDPNVSRRHAELTFTGSDWSIEDLNSTNGTMVNNRRITRCPLRNGDVLTFGLSTFEFRG